jgi:hypothetical protein
MNSNSMESPAAIRKSITVACDQEHAFRTWVQRIDLWWPKQHSRSGNRATIVVLEPFVGGRFFERTPDGSEYVWGSVTSWNPPYALAFHWYLGSSAEQPTRVEITFSDLGARRTRVDVRHEGADVLGAQWLHTSQIFDHAWQVVLAAYQEDHEASEPPDDD